MTMSTAEGRRRCGILEHRRQIRSLQRQNEHLQTIQRANWNDGALLRADRDQLRVELRKQEAKRYDLWRIRRGFLIKYFILGLCTGVVLLAVVVRLALS